MDQAVSVSIKNDNLHATWTVTLGSHGNLNDFIGGIGLRAVSVFSHQAQKIQKILLWKMNLEGLRQRGS